MSDFFWELIAPLFLVLALISTVVFVCLWIGSGTDEWSWTNIDDNCGVFTTKVNDAWFTPGEDGPLVREVYCRKMP